MPSCPACGSALTPDPEEPLEFAILSEPGAMREKFPDAMEMAMLRNYYCEKCDSTLALTASKATYTKTKVEEGLK